jgi:hypothetical protein
MEGYVYAQVIVEGSTDIPVVTALMYAADGPIVNSLSRAPTARVRLTGISRSTGKPLAFSHTSSFVTSIRTVRDAP